jgi:hypothetical protein
MRDKKRPRISAAQIAEIKRLRAEGWGLRAIAETLGVSVNSASRHGQLPPPRRPAIYPNLPRGSFIQPPSLAQLMAGR